MYMYCVYTYMYMYYVYIHVHVLCIHTCIYCVYTYAYTYITHTHTCTCIYCVYTYMLYLTLCVPAGQCKASELYVDQLKDVLLHCAPKSGVAAFIAEVVQVILYEASVSLLLLLYDLSPLIPLSCHHIHPTLDRLE